MADGGDNDDDELDAGVHIESMSDLYVTPIPEPMDKFPLGKYLIDTYDTLMCALTNNAITYDRNELARLRAAWNTYRVANYDLISMYGTGDTRLVSEASLLWRCIVATNILIEKPFDRGQHMREKTIASFPHLYVHLNLGVAEATAPILSYSQQTLLYALRAIGDRWHRDLTYSEELMEYLFLLEVRCSMLIVHPLADMGVFDVKEYRHIPSRSVVRPNDPVYFSVNEEFNAETSAFFAHIGKSIHVHGYFPRVRVTLWDETIRTRFLDMMRQWARAKKYGDFRETLKEHVQRRWVRPCEMERYQRLHDGNKPDVITLLQEYRPSEQTMFMTEERLSQRQWKTIEDVYEHEEGWIHNLLALRLFHSHLFGEYEVEWFDDFTVDTNDFFLHSDMIEGTEYPLVMEVFNTYGVVFLKEEDEDEDEDNDDVDDERASYTRKVFYECTSVEQALCLWCMFVFQSTRGVLYDDGDDNKSIKRLLVDLFEPSEPQVVQYEQAGGFVIPSFV